MIRILFIILASIFLSLGIVGIAVPGLPTTPFLLLSVWMYSKSSKRLQNWILNHHIFGEKIRIYQETKSLTLKTKISAISLMWIMVMGSCFIFIDNLHLRIFLLMIAVIGTIVMGFIIKTRK